MMNEDEIETRVDHAVETKLPEPDLSAASSEADVLLARIEKSLGEVRAHMSAASRESRHKEFSLALLAGGLAQAIVIGLLVWALSDVIFAAGPADSVGILIKLAFAAVLQLVALTAFIAPRR